MILHLQTKHLAKLILIISAVKTSGVRGFKCTELEPTYVARKRFDHYPNHTSLPADYFD